MGRKKITAKARALAKLMANGNYSTKKEALAKAGYSESAQKIPKRAMQGKGTQLALVEEATKVGAIIDAMSARLATEDWNDYTGEQVVDMMKKVSEAQKNILSSIPKQEDKYDPNKWNVIDINVD